MSIIELQECINAAFLQVTPDILQHTWMDADHHLEILQVVIFPIGCYSLGNSESKLILIRLDYIGQWWPFPLTSSPVLIMPDFNEIFLWTTDASNIAIGAILEQQIGGHLHPIAYASRKLSKSQFCV